MNNFIKNKGKPSRTTTTAAVEEDELALVKSAAWAWYEHGSGSGSEGRPIRESDASRTKTDPKPSRYKLEALRNNNKVQQVSKLRSSSSGNNSLLDHYEVERISRQLDYYIESSRAKYRRSFSGGGGGGHAAEEPVAAAAEMKSVSNKVTTAGGKKVGKGSRLKHIPVACRSSRGDVVESHRKFVYSRPEKGGGVVAVVEVGSCRPRAWGVRA